ncbi:hypothetical protein B0H13DRAFT_2476143 [Mycena leptocephala]|nr:hypothetical protein B0H13DRAFT_2476143 [Mycena leptocephala]
MPSYHMKHGQWPTTPNDANDQDSQLREAEIKLRCTEADSGILAVRAASLALSAAELMKTFEISMYNNAQTALIHLGYMEADTMEPYRPLSHRDTRRKETHLHRAKGDSRLFDGTAWYLQSGVTISQAAAPSRGEEGSEDGESQLLAGTQTLKRSGGFQHNRRSQKHLKDIAPDDVDVQSEGVKKGKSKKKRDGWIWLESLMRRQGQSDEKLAAYKKERQADCEEVLNGGLNGKVTYGRMQAAMHRRLEHNAKVIFKSAESGAHHDWVSATSFDELVSKLDGWHDVVFQWMDDMMIMTVSRESVHPRKQTGVQIFVDDAFLYRACSTSRRCFAKVLSAYRRTASYSDSCKAQNVVFAALIRAKRFAPENDYLVFTSTHLLGLRQDWNHLAYLHFLCLLRVWSSRIRRTLPLIAEHHERFPSPHRKPVSADRYRMMAGPSGRDGALSLDASTRYPKLLLSGTQSPSSLATKSQCPPTDNDGGTLAAGVGGLICIYPNLDCFYRASPGPHRVPKFQFSNHCPNSELENHRIRNQSGFQPPQGTGDVSESATVRNHIPVRVITGISVALAIVALCFVGLLFVRVMSGRHAAKIGNIEINPQARAISPFTFIIEAGDVNNDSPSDTRRTGAACCLALSCAFVLYLRYVSYVIRLSLSSILNPLARHLASAQTVLRRITSVPAPPAALKLTSSFCSSAASSASDLLSTPLVFRVIFVLRYTSLPPLPYDIPFPSHPQYPTFALPHSSSSLPPVLPLLLLLPRPALVSVFLLPSSSYSRVQADRTKDPFDSTRFVLAYISAPPCPAQRSPSGFLGASPIGFGLSGSDYKIIGFGARG